jgi:release factor family 10
MIPKQELQELAEFWTEEGDALSFYFSPETPTELAHREEPILTKEKIQELFGTLRGNNAAMRADIDRVLEVASSMKGNQGRSKVIFACHKRDFWRAYDLDARFPSSVTAGKSFQLAPLSFAMAPHKRYCIALTDRNRSRLLILENGKIQEHSSALDEQRDPQDKVRTTGTGGSNHEERQREEMVRQHFKFLASHLLHFHEHKDFDALVFGCREAMWPEIEAVLHTDLKRVLLGHFRVDIGLATPEEIQRCAQALIDEEEKKEESSLVEAAVGGAAADGLGAVGLTDVLQAMELGEVRTLLWQASAGNGGSPVSVCSACGHAQAGESSTCDLCSQATRFYARPEEALLRSSLAGDVPMRPLLSNALPPPEQFAAVLRFRADHNTNQVLAS